jgi:hypothetical protein
MPLKTTGGQIMSLLLVIIQVQHFAIPVVVLLVLLLIKGFVVVFRGAGLVVSLASTCTGQ